MYFTSRLKADTLFVWLENQNDNYIFFFIYKLCTTVLQNPSLLFLVRTAKIEHNVSYSHLKSYNNLLPTDLYVPCCAVVTMLQRKKKSHQQLIILDFTKNEQAICFYNRVFFCVVENA